MRMDEGCKEIVNSAGPGLEDRAKLSYWAARIFAASVRARWRAISMNFESAAITFLAASTGV